MMRKQWIALALALALLAALPAWTALPARAEVPVITVTMDPGEGSGTPESFASNESGRMASDYHSAGEGQFWVEDGSLWLKLPGKPDAFGAPAQNMIFTGWDYRNGSKPGEAYIITSDLTLTAQWAEAGNARLLSLTPSSGTLNREFDPYYTVNTLVVLYTGSPVSVTVEAVAQDPGATVEYLINDGSYGYTCPAMTADRDTVSIRVTNGANEETYKVTLGILYTLTLTTEGQGTAKAYEMYSNEEKYTGSNGTTSILKATPAAGWQFREWQLVSGGGSLTNASYQNGRYRFGPDNAVVKAVFEPLSTYAVTVDGGTGGGNYAQGTSVAVAADAPEAGKRFKEWTATGIALTDAQRTAASFTFAMPANAVALTATYESIPAAAAPTFSPPGGTYDAAQSVTISCATDGATIHYTTDGSAPTADSAAYGGPIDIDETATVKAIAVKDGWLDSAVAEATYVIQPPTFTVTYRVVDGAWADGSAEDITETVVRGASPAGIPSGMVAAAGYTGGAWDSNPAGAVITEDATFTYAFQRITYPISDDRAAQAYFYDGSFNQVFPEAAAEGTELSLWVREGARPREGYYFTDWYTVKVDGEVWASPVREFTMPAAPVDISAIQQPRETLALAFDGGSQALPLDAWMQLQSLDRDPPLILYDEASGTETLDVNGDGLPDLRVTFPLDEGTDFTLTRLPACAAVGSFAFAFSGPMDRYGAITFSIPQPSFGPAAFVLPDDLATIEAGAFEGDAAITVVDAHSCTSIGANAFRNCAGLTQILVHKECRIDGTAFAGCGTVVVFAPAGGAAQAGCAGRTDVVFVPVAQE